MDRRIAERLSNFDEEGVLDLPQGGLPLLEAWRTASCMGEGRPFADVDVLFIQHQLGDIIPRLEAMIESGLDKTRCWFVDIPYSTNPLVRRDLVEMGFAEDHITRVFTNPLEDYSVAQSWRVALLLQKIADRKNPRPLLVIDDGAYFLRYLASVRSHQPELVREFRHSRVVEQTTRGLRYLENPGTDQLLKECHIPAVSIAKCKTKTEFEAPFVGAVVSRALTRAVGNDRLASLRRIAIIGYGAIGRATLDALRAKLPDATIHVIEVRPDERLAAASSGANCQTLPQFPERGEYELVVGCTGTNSFRLEQRKLLAHGALLASGSSGDVEFNRAGFVDLADQFPDDEIEVLNREKALREGIHATIDFMREGGKTFSFVNAGFPANFDGLRECLPARVTQATQSLLFAAACQVVREDRPGLWEFAESEDKWILDNALGYL